MLKIISFLLMFVLISLSAGIVLSQAWQGVVGGSAKLMESSVKSAAKDSMGEKLVIMSASQAANKPDSIIVKSNAKSTTITFTPGVQTPYLFTDTAGRTWHVDPVSKTASLAYIKANSQEDLKNIQLDTGELFRLYKINNHSYYLAFDSRDSQDKYCGRILSIPESAAGVKTELTEFANFYNTVIDLTAEEKALLQFTQDTGLIVKNADTGIYSPRDQFLSCLIIPLNNQNYEEAVQKTSSIIDGLITKFNNTMQSEPEEDDRKSLELLLQIGLLRLDPQNGRYIVVEKSTDASPGGSSATKWESVKNNVAIPHELSHMAFESDLEYMTGVTGLFKGLSETQQTAIGYFLVVTGKVSGGYSLNTITGEFLFPNITNISEEWAAYFSDRRYVEKDLKVELACLLEDVYPLQGVSENSQNRLKQYINEGVFGDDFLLEKQAKLAEIRGSAISRLFSE